MNYIRYTAEELAQDDLFRRWVLQPDSETDLFWTDFLRQHPHKQPVVVTAKALLKAVERMAVVPTQEQGHRMWMAIEDRIQEEPDPTDMEEPGVFSINFRSILAVAATLILLMGLGWLFYDKPQPGDLLTLIDPQTEAVVALLEKRNETNQPLTVWLNDSSRVVLQPRSQISYPERPAVDKRDVYLVGAGFFEVVKNANRPFRVYANGLVTQVVGTSFSINAFAEQKQVTVAVRTGKVAVFTINAFLRAQANREQIAGMVLLTRNQQALFDIVSERITRSLVNEPVLLRQPAN